MHWEIRRLPSVSDRSAWRVRFEFWPGALCQSPNPLYARSNVEMSLDNTDHESGTLHNRTLWLDRSIPLPLHVVDRSVGMSASFPPDRSAYSCAHHTETGRDKSSGRFPAASSRLQDFVLQ